MAVKGGYLLLTGGGAVLIWSGLRGKRWSDVIRGFISGTPPTKVTTALAIQGGLTDATYTGARPGGSTLGNLIVANAQANELPYQWAGVPATGHADCSSWVNWIIGHITGLAIPLYGPGQYTGQAHGPATSVWAVWTGTRTIPRSQMQPGDLVIWPLIHMGIVTGPGQMISDLNPSLNVRNTPITQGPGGGYIIRRLNAVG